MDRAEFAASQWTTERPDLNLLPMTVLGRLAEAEQVIGRDHLDSGSVARPNRETEAMQDGSDAVSDWPMLNALLNTASGATWVSIHHGGGVGMGFSQHAGVVIVCDGSAELEIGPGSYQVVVERGPEYQRVTRMIEIAGNQPHEVSIWQAVVCCSSIQLGEGVGTSFPGSRFCFGRTFNATMESTHGFHFLSN